MSYHLLSEYVNDKIHLLQEVGHFLAAFPKKVKLSIPYFIPNITLGSFGAITQVMLIHISLVIIFVKEPLLF